MARRSGGGRGPRPAPKRRYPRTARLNTLLQQIVADYLELIDDDRIGFLTVTGVEVDADLNRAQVYISALADESEDDEILAALDDYRIPIQGAIGRSARLRKTPEVAFAFDPAVRTGARIDTILASLDLPAEEDPDEDVASDGDLVGDDGADDGADPRPDGEVRS